MQNVSCLKMQSFLLSLAQSYPLTSSRGGSEPVHLPVLHVRGGDAAGAGHQDDGHRGQLPPARVRRRGAARGGGHHRHLQPLLRRLHPRPPPEQLPAVTLELEIQPYLPEVRRHKIVIYPRITLFANEAHYQSIPISIFNKYIYCLLSKYLHLHIHFANFLAELYFLKGEIEAGSMKNTQTVLCTTALVLSTSPLPNVPYFTHIYTTDTCTGYLNICAGEEDNI